MLVLGVTFWWLARMPWLLLLPVGSLIDGSPLTFPSWPECSIQQWNEEVACPLATCPIRPACWVDTPDRSFSSLSRAVQDAWEVYGEELLGVPHDLFLRLREAYDCASVDDFWDVWSAGAEEGLFRAYCRAGGPVAGGAQRYLGRGRLRVRRRRSGGRSVGGCRF